MGLEISDFDVPRDQANDGPAFFKDLLDTPGSPVLLEATLTITTLVVVELDEHPVIQLFQVSHSTIHGWAYHVDMLLPFGSDDPEDHPVVRDEVESNVVTSGRIEVQVEAAVPFNLVFGGPDLDENLRI